MFDQIEVADNWYEDRNKLLVAAQYMYDEGYEVGDFVDLIDKPQNYTAEYKAAIAERLVDQEEEIAT